MVTKPVRYWCENDTYGTEDPEINPTGRTTFFFDNYFKKKPMLEERQLLSQMVLMKLELCWVQGCPSSTPALGDKVGGVVST